MNGKGGSETRLEKKKTRGKIKSVLTHRLFMCTAHSKLALTWLLGGDVGDGARGSRARRVVRPHRHVVGGAPLQALDDG